ncbi:MAG: 2,5-didehydrogluconate reductase [Thalassospira sp.]|uniref:aldo/keto reductase n=1 Tax=Thalassospira sp. TaxID=1912094 RepID=UPI000C4080BE|nr:aldo/keto reductase [Thalassospira sp.]MAZ34414.1 2,5-didehydrogluconate reductase [Thalassospira sp.]|tara:strand:+ start:1097 stop:1921 length:825 start_codon:yes stop_codon:yes gene_type:complete
MFDVSANGAVIPALGFGTFRMPEADVLRIVPKAIKTGFRHIDTAQIYDNEAAVGQAILDSGVPRKDIFLTTKVWVSNYKHDAFIKSVDESLEKLETDYVDLLLLHWPNNDVSLADQIGALNEVRQAGKARHIGVSNFNIALMDEAVALSDAPLVTNQVEYHPFIDQTKVMDGARKHGMALTAYYAMADGKVLENEQLGEIAKSHDRSVAQVVLRWLLQQNDVIALSKTATESRVAENFDIFDFELSGEEMQAIHGLADENGRIVSPDGLAPDWD